MVAGGAVGAYHVVLTSRAVDYMILRDAMDDRRRSIRRSRSLGHEPHRHVDEGLNQIDRRIARLPEGVDIGNTRADPLEQQLQLQRREPPPEPEHLFAVGVGNAHQHAEATDRQARGDVEDELALARDEMSSTISSATRAISGLNASYVHRPVLPDSPLAAAPD
ncbi:hypothetical protein [Sphingomonas sp.]|uniref:hypothetical protein n=1 Tax=Sphingomonas sp. TaxID=28214 RepID=UPI003CC5523F